jgi:hypothetical protein
LVWLDLSAGPFNWGAIVGGLGVRTLHSLPHVSTFASHHRQHTPPSATSVTSKKNDNGDDDEEEEESGRIADHVVEINWEVILAEKLVMTPYDVR